MFFVVLGFLGWLIATIAFRLLGKVLLDPSNSVFTIATFAVSVPLIAIVMYGIYTWQQVKQSERPKIAMQIALPGMLLDVGSILLFPIVFPNIDPTANVVFSALMLWGYSFILLSSFLPMSVNPKT